MPWLQRENNLRKVASMTAYWAVRIMKSLSGSRSMETVRKGLTEHHFPDPGGTLLRILDTTCTSYGENRLACFINVFFTEVAERKQALPFRLQVQDKYLSKLKLETVLLVRLV